MLAYLFVLLAVVVHARFIPMAFHFTPVAAALLYFGARMPRKQMVTPLLLLVASDIYLTKVHYGYPLTADHLVTWAWYAGIILLGGLLANTWSALRIGAASLAASVSFFVISNAMVWMVWRDMYPATFHGLTLAYVAGLPFFRNTVVSDLLFTGVFFGLGYLLQRRHVEATSLAR
jgi:hypothetical protein